MPTKASTKPSASYSHSCFKHYFVLKDVNENELIKITKPLFYTAHEGSWDWKKSGINTFCLTYEAADEFETSEEFALALANEISEIFKKAS